MAKKKGGGGGGGSKPAPKAAPKPAGGGGGAVKKQISQAAKAGNITKKEAKLLNSAVDKAKKTGPGKQVGKGVSKNEKQYILNQLKAATKKSAGGQGVKLAKEFKGDVNKFLGDKKFRKDENKKFTSQQTAGQTTVFQTQSAFSALTFPQSSTTSSTSSPVQNPARDVVDLALPPIDAETIIGVLFENLSATELTKFVRYDTVEGEDPKYSIISNLSDIRRKFDPARLISSQSPDSSYFSKFIIDLNSKIPSVQFLESRSDVSEENLQKYVWIDEATGNLIIELINIEVDEAVEIQFDTNGTIYEVQL
jgi:hypothetical protein